MNKVSSKYLAVLGILTIVILGSQLLMQTTISGSKSDARIINISGRQRMLSQKITKGSLKLSNARSIQEFETIQKELDGSFHLWNQSHEDLQYGSEEIDVSDMNGSNELNLLYEDIEPYFQAIKAAAIQLSQSRYEDHVDLSGASQMKTQIDQISTNEATFLNLMNKITFQYDKQASSKVERLAEVELYLMTITFILIILEAFFIFRPMYMDGKEKIQTISELSELRIEEKAFASHQIEEANQRINSLKHYAFKLKGEMIKKSDEFSEKWAIQIKKYSKLAEEYEKLKTREDIRKGNFNAMDDKSTISV